LAEYDDSRTGSALEVSRRLFLYLGAAAAAAPELCAEDAPQPIYLSDMRQCLPAEALALRPQRRHWRLLPYETERFKGFMLVAGQNTAAPEIRIPLPQKGWHAISFGIRSYGGGEDTTRLLVRLKTDDTFSLITHTDTERNRIDDYFWKVADLDGAEIILRQFRLQTVPDSPDSAGNASNGVWLAYVKLVPLTEPQIVEFQAEKLNMQHRRLFAHHDAWSYTFAFRPTTEADIRREIEPFRDTDFSRLYWEGGAGDRMYYPTKRGLTPADDWIDDPYRTGDRLAAETWRSWRAQGIDPYRVALEHAQRLGMEFHGTYRMGGFHFPVPEDVWNQDGFYDHHPELRCTNRQGQRTSRLSYAYPEVRQEAIGFLKEMASYPVDGICLAYNRRPPLLEYEPPIVESFRTRYSSDPRRLDDHDPRWLAHRATVLTGFMREVRDALAQSARLQNRSKPFELTAIVMGTEQENLYNAMDLAIWVGEGLVDTIVPYTSGSGLESSGDSWVNPKDAEFFLKITSGTRTRLALNMMPRVLPPEVYRRRAHALYSMGVEHLFFWDCNARYDCSPSWSALRRLGHREELAASARRGSPLFEQPGQHLDKLGDWDLRYATPG
jgi:hypothetical protein